MTPVQPRLPLAFVRDRFVPLAEASVPLFDAGYVQGATLSEQLRTFNGRIFLWDEHLARLRRGAEELGIDDQLAWSKLHDIALRLVGANFSLVPTGGDLGLAVLVSPGSYAAFSGGHDYGPTVAMHTYPLPFSHWAEHYTRGVDLVVTAGRMVSGDAWPRWIKARSRLHYLLADRQAAAIQPGAKALLTDEAGRVTETAIANILLVSRYGDQVVIRSPRREHEILPGVSLGFVEQLARKQGWTWEERTLAVHDLASAEEIWLTSTPSCLLPVRSIDQVPVPQCPGSIYKEVLRAWSKAVGRDIAGQAVSVAANPADARVS